MQSSRLAMLSRFSFILALGLSAFAAEVHRTVRQIEIHSGWGGLVTPQNADVIIRREKGEFLRDGKPVDASQVRVLVAALEAPPVAKPDMENLGATSAWLKTQVSSQHPKGRAQSAETTESQRELFEISFTNIELIAKVIPSLFRFTRFDDYPGAQVEVVFEDGSKLTAVSHSYYVYMLPWKVTGHGAETYNAQISRAVSALLPRKTVNKERLAGDDFLTELVDAVMSSIETEWNLRGVESRAGDALSALRSAYTVERADINPYHNVDYGIPWSAKGPHETNLHVTMRKATFPKNVLEELVLLYDHNKVEGVAEFLKTGAKYEDMALSVPWLNDYIREHPKETVFVMYVHDTSFGDQAMRTFALDMKARGREDLIPTVRAQQAQLVLLKIGYVYWILFPDKHMMLWRYEGPSGFLKWKQSDFSAGRCGAYPVNNGGCSGREITAGGTLVLDQAPRDEGCVAAYRKDQNSSASPPEALFPVMDHGRGGYIDRMGKVRIPLCFDTVSDFSEGLARFERDGKWGYIDATGTVVIEPKFPWAEEFSEGLSLAQITGETLGYDGRWGFIDKAGKVVIAPVYGRSYDDAQDKAFHEGLAKIEVDGKTGFIDKTGKVVIQPQFSYAYPFAEGLAAVTKSSTGKDGWGYIDRTGKWIIPPQFEWASLFSEQLAPVNRNHDCGYIDLSGSYVLRPPVSPGEKDCATVWGDFAEGLSRWKFGNKYGFIDHSGKVVIEPLFDLTFHFSEGLAAVQIGGKWGYIDTAGKIVIEPRTLTTAKDFHNGLAYVVTKSGEHGYIDKSGHYAWKPTLQGID